MYKKEEKFRIAVIGTGVIAQTVATAVNRHEVLTISCVAARDRSRAESFATNNNIPNVFDSYDDLIRSSEYDLIYVSTINSTHYDIALKCLEMKRAVFVEKPICENVGQVKHLVERSRQNNTFLSEAMPLRFSSNMLRVRKLIHSNDIGTVRLMISNIGINSWDAPRIREKDMGGGALNDLGIYGVTMSDMIFGPNLVTIKSCQNEDNMVDSQNTIIMSYTDVQSIIYNSVKLQTRGLSIIYGDYGKIVIDKSYSAERVIKLKGIRGTRIYKSRKNRYVEELEACMRAINISAIEPCEYSHADMIKTHELMDMIRKDF